MLNLSGKELNELVEFTYPLCVSLYIPTDPVNVDIRINKTAFKNAVDITVSQLQKLGYKPDSYQAFAEKSAALLNEEIFWKEREKSFAVLAAGEDVHTFDLSTSVSEFLMISDHFYCLPFLSALNPQATFYVLELDKKNTQMWRGTANMFEMSQIPDLPKSVEEVTGVEAGGRALQFHTGTDAPRGSNRPAMFHGTSSWQDDKDRYLERFLQTVDKAVCTFLNQSPEPLFISGAEELIVMYRKLSKYNQLEPENLPKVDDPTQRQLLLHQAALAVIKSRLQIEKAAVVARFEEESRADRKVDVLAEIIRQAYQGKVETLLLAEGERVWGTFAPETLTVIIEDEQQPMSAELLNLAARLTLMNSGEVVLMPKEQLLSNSPAMALLRY